MNLSKFFNKTPHKYCLFHFYCQAKKKERMKEPNFKEISKIFWFVNWTVVFIHFLMAMRWYAYLASLNLPDLAGEVMILPFVSLFIASMMVFLYRYPQYSNIPYSLLLEELPAKRQEEIRYVFKQLIVTSTGYLSVFFLTAGIHMVGAMIGLKSGLFISIYAFLTVLILAKFSLATWFIKATRK